MAILIKDSVGSIVIQLTTSADDLPATGLTFSDVTADLKKAGGSFASFTLTGANFIDLGAGTYQVNLAVGDTNTLGDLHLRVSGATINTYLDVSLVAESVVTSPTTVPDLPTTVLFGFVRSPSNIPVAGASVSYRILSIPSIANPSGEAVLLSAELITVKTDSQGFFSFDAITGAVIDLFIPAASYRRTLTVPSATINIFTLP